ncbi:MAG: DUF305 domain-containing protein [Propionibacteriaceae bacterium]|nr:DUF305 domain-containing protein [Propionibacteriaceae bacterium]
MNPTNRAVALVGGLVLAISLAGCGTAAEDPGSSTGDPVSSAPSTAPATQPTEDSSSSASVEHNDADVTFAQMMTVHHEGALEMAKLAAQRADSGNVKDLAAKIEAAQLPEIELMERWLTVWEEPLEPEGHAGMDHGGMDMNGMSQEEVMAELEQKTGPDFDTQFLTAMIAHHEGAVVMSEEELTDGLNPEALDLAQAIIDAQQSEIQEMQQLLETQ